MSEGYSGWKNYETWAVALWIDNDQGLYDERRERVRTAINTAEACDQVADGTWTQERANVYVTADELKSWVCDELAPDLGASLWAYLLGASLDEVDWRELAEYWIDDETENEKENGE